MESPDRRRTLTAKSPWARHARRLMEEGPEAPRAWLAGPSPSKRKARAGANFQRTPRRRRTVEAVAVLLTVAFLPAHARAAQWTLIGWNNLGMHCTGRRVLRSSRCCRRTTRSTRSSSTRRAGWYAMRTGITVTYEAVADPDGSINTTSAGKTNFWESRRGAVRRRSAGESGAGGLLHAGRGKRTADDVVRPRPGVVLSPRAFRSRPTTTRAARTPIRSCAWWRATPRGRCWRPPTSCCRSPTRSTARPATPPTRAGGAAARRMGQRSRPGARHAAQHPAPARRARGAAGAVPATRWRRPATTPPVCSRRRRRTDSRFSARAAISRRHCRAAASPASSR